MNADIVVDTRELEPLFRELADLGGKKAGALIRERAGLLGRVLAERTVPFMPLKDPAAQRETGRRTVVKGIASVYVVASKIYEEIRRKIGDRAAKAWRKLLKTDPEKADRIIKLANIRGGNLSIREFDGGYAHMRLLPTLARRGVANRPPIVISSAKELQKYRAQELRRVGRAKSGWIAAARQIPGAKGFSGLPAFMRQRDAPGTGYDGTRNTDNPFVTLKNNVGYIDKLMRGWRMVEGQDAFEKLLAKDIRAQIAHLKAKHRA